MTDQSQPSRPSPQLIYARVREDAEDQLARTHRALAFSGLFAGFTMGASYLALAIVLVTVTGPSEKLVAALLYPVGYIAVILGRAQLFTENTLYPVVPCLEERRHIPKTARLWAIVVAGNLIGGAAFALLITKTPALAPGIVSEFAGLGDEAAARSFAKVFWSGILAGWMLALVAWLVEAGDSAIDHFFVVWLLTLVVGLASFDHSVATAVAVMGALFDGRVALGEAVGWEATAILGNVIGGVMIVALLNYGQVHAGEAGG